MATAASEQYLWQSPGWFAIGQKTIKCKYLPSSVHSSNDYKAIINSNIRESFRAHNTAEPGLEKRRLFGKSS